VSIKVGEPAPPVSVDAYVRGEDDPVPLDIGGRGDSWTVLLFYPGDFTFVCPTELCAFLELEEEFDAEDARLVAASTDSWHERERPERRSQPRGGPPHPQGAAHRRALPGLVAARAADAAHRGLRARG
jgi:alkyl hydroperoxide reductase subunit AhpC